jgi:hypothetical protein
VASLDLVDFQALRVAQEEAALAALQVAQVDSRGREVEAHQQVQASQAVADSTGPISTDSEVTVRTAFFKTAGCNPSVAGCRFSFNQCEISSLRSS